MVIPSTFFGIASLVILVIPGVVFAGTRSWLRGYRASDQEVSSRILDAVVISVILDILYLWFIGPALVSFFRDPRDSLVQHPGVVGFLLLLTCVIIPGAIATGWHAEIIWKRPRSARLPAWVRIPRRQTAYESTPTAWDKKAPRQTDSWIKVRLPDGKIVAGWISGDSFFSTYPHSRDVYIQEQFAVDAAGAIGDKVPNTGGVWLSIPDGSIVEWLREPPAEETS
ncbi:DUF6338 family protein [Cryobacterium sp. MDB2-33-2]|uniref:DUF6338 family protein n=1 Tax=Cryobacterium sp. MDB2-33-2 TaxID=1259179 RepID=UPI00106C077A|nr:DUF6338 family protein [Cryobacterium sp. MDB2-33-2]TFC04039.1 hypothetical protein E3O59_14955 [Cryobacterium sp. MDB2-33-2]